MDLGPHAVFIWVSYAAVLAVVCALIGWLIVDGRRLTRISDDLDRRGVGRRASRAPADGARG